MGFCNNEYKIRLPWQKTENTHYFTIPYTIACQQTLEYKWKYIDKKRLNTNGLIYFKKIVNNVKHYEIKKFDTYLFIVNKKCEQEESGNSDRYK